MKDKEAVKRKEVVLTARIRPDLHAQAKVKLFSERKSFQDVITTAIERFVQSSTDCAEAPPAVRQGPDPYALIAALHRELVQKKSDESVTGPSGKAVLLKRYLEDIREILEDIDRIFLQSAQGDPYDTLGTDQKTENSAERNSAREAVPGTAAGNRDADDSDRAREVISNAERVSREARASIEDARRSAGSGIAVPQQRKPTRKKAG